jgi:hypothetical protein
MCYSADLSLLSLSFGIFASLMLINFGSKQSQSTNKAIGYFFLFITLIQLVEYFLWIDIDCVNGFNKVGALLGPILNHLQPIVLLLIASTFLEPANLISSSIIIPANIIYFIYCGYHYVKYVSDESNLCIRTNDCNHLDWTWKKDFNYLFYFAISFINIANFYTNINLMVSFGISYILLIISIFRFNKNIGEFWCLMATGVPLINLFMENILNINN